MDGVTATRQIRRFEEAQNLKPTKVIALTGLASTSTRIEAMSSGANHFLTKPVRFNELLALLKPHEGSTVETANERSRWLSNEVSDSI
jgi:DNA-binding response OmpR family regulator